MKTLYSTMRYYILPLVCAGALLAYGLSVREQAENEANDRLSFENPVYQIQGDDHVRGDPSSARYVVINYSDTECPYCKREHEDLEPLFREYGDKFAFVYRHATPPSQPYKRSLLEAQALECAGLLFGEDMFWAYLDAIYRTTKSHDTLLVDELFALASGLGMDEDTIRICTDVEERALQKVERDRTSAILSGLRIVPTTVVIDQKEHHIRTLDGLSTTRLRAILGAPEP